MDRRAFFGAVAVAVAGASLALGATPPAAPPLRAVYRYCRETDTWHRCRMYELRPGDVCRLDEVGTFVVHDEPTQGPDGRWGVNAVHELDPQTNQWKPCNG